MWGFRVKVSETAERIDMEKLKAREHIMFFDEVLLFEDELHDHGVSMLSVKIVSAVFLSRGTAKSKWAADLTLMMTMMFLVDAASDADQLLPVDAFLPASGRSAD